MCIRLYELQMLSMSADWFGKSSLQAEPIVTRVNPLQKGIAGHVQRPLIGAGGVECTCSRGPPQKGWRHDVAAVVVARGISSSKDYAPSPRRERQSSWNNIRSFVAACSSRVRMHVEWLSGKPMD